MNPQKKFKFCYRRKSSTTVVATLTPPISRRKILNSSSMSTIETLIVQIFDRKRQIIDQLKHHKLLYDQHLVSKLLIQGISPPPWLLPSDFPPSSSNFSAIDKAGLISGLLHPRPGHVASCPVSQGVSYDKAVSVANTYATDEECAGNFASNTGCDEDYSSVIPQCQTDNVEDRAVNVLQSHAEINACELNHAPMSPEKRSYKRTCDAHPNQEQSLVKIQRSKSRQRALEIRNSAKTSGKSRLGTSNNVSAPSQNKSCLGDEKLDAPIESLKRVRPFSLSETFYKQGASNEVRSPIDPECLLTQFGDDDVAEAHAGGSLKRDKTSSVSVGIITGSRSLCRQSKSAITGSNAREYIAPVDVFTEAIESDKAFVLPIENSSCNEESGPCSVKSSSDATDISLSRNLTMNNIGGSPFADKSSEVDDANDLRESLELVKPFSATMKVKSPNSYADKLTLTAYNEAKEVHGEDSCETEKGDGICVRGMTSSNGFCQQSGGVSSASNRQSYSEQLHGSRGYKESHKALAFPSGICSLETRTGTCSTDRSIDACNASLPRDLGIKNNVDVISGNTNSQGDEQLNGLRESPELINPLSITTKTCDNEDASIKMTRTSSCCQLFKDAPSSSKTYGSSEQVSGSKEPYVSDKISEIPTEISPWKEANGGCLIPESHNASDVSLAKSADSNVKDGQTRDDVGPCLIKESCNAGDISLAKSADDKSKDGLTRDDGEEKRNSSLSADKVYNTSTSGRQSSSGALFSGKTSGFGRTDNEIRESANFAEQIASPRRNLSEEDADTMSRQQEVQDLEDSGRNVMVTMTCGHKLTPASNLSIDRKNIAVEPSDSYSKKLEIETEPGSSERCVASIVEGLVTGQCDVSSSAAPLPDRSKANDCKSSPEAWEKSAFSIVSPVIDRMDVDDADLAMPDFESFGAQNFGDGFPFNVMERSSLPEHIIRSACFTAPVSPFPAACISSVAFGFSKNVDSSSTLGKQQPTSSCLSTPSSPFPAACNMRLQPGIYSSVPNGILENIDLRSNLLSVGSVLQRNSRSDIFSFPRNQSRQDFRIPFLSPDKMGSEVITSRSGGSEEVRSGNPELTCFTIMEDPESSEEDVNEGKTGSEETDTSVKSDSIKEPLCDITVNNNISLFPDNAVEKRCVESTSKEYDVSEISDVNSRANDMNHRRRSKRMTQGKENKGFSIGGNSCTKKIKALSSRFSKSKLSTRSSLRIRGQSMSEKEPKRNNIVSNVKSFVPLVQQKQAVATVPVKRDIKVKALEVAEAAKRLAQKKEDERRQKKEALKIERARLEQENLKQMELAKKLKEELKKKREAENAAKKRQRAEEENKEKERKRKRVEDARCEQKKAQEKIQVWREESRYGPQEERTLEGKELNRNAKTEVDGEITTSISVEPVNELVGGDSSARKDAGDGIPSLSSNIFTAASLTGKVDSIVSAENSTPLLNKGDNPTRQTIEEQSYDISPYQCSDDEEEEDDETPNKKFIPSWASKSSVSQVLSSLQHLDPDTIFPPGTFCSLDEVLLPKRLPQDLRK